MGWIISEFEIAVGTSRKWDAREAGREVARNTIEKLSNSPKCFFLFSTIHYEKHGGFEEFLNGVWDILPSGTPLIGGTIAGFINTQGCFTRGASALAISYPNMDIAIGIGNNTKRNPEKAVKDCVELINKQNSKPNFYFEFISGPIIPNFPGLGKQTVIKSKTSGNLMKKMIPTLFKANMGTDRADEFLNHLVNYINNPLIGAVCYDDGKLSKNYQFYNNKILKNSAILLGVSTDFIPEFQTVTALKERNVKIKVTVEKDGRTVTHINGKPATQELFRILNWGKSSVREVEKFYSQAFYYPFCYKKGDKIHAVMLGLILGENIYFANKIETDELELFGMTGKKIISQCEDIFLKNSNFIYGVICETYVETLGNNIYKIKELIDKNTKDYLLIFAGGESIIYNDMIPHHLYESINILRI